MIDVLVVGAGSAGCVLADRLSSKGLSVCVVEAGPDLRSATTPASITGESFFDALAEPGLIHRDLEARRVDGQAPRPYLRGRGVGGSSAVNAMVGLWGEMDDYDSWERDFGCVGWGWRDVERCFRRIEVPLRRAEPEGPGSVAGSLVEACIMSGWALHRGPFPLAGIPADAGPAMLTRDANGRRVTAADAYLERARERGNVVVRTDVAVDRVVVEGGRAVGVLLVDGTEIGAREVVLCAGAIHSPTILSRSGIDRHDADLQLLPINHLGPDALGYGSISVALMKVSSRGSVRLNPNDPLAEPIVDFDLLSRDEDVESLTVGVGVLLELLESPSLASLARGFFVDDRGTALAEIAGSPDSVRAWMREATGDYVHAAGTCAMGDPRSESTVVDSDARVIGVAGLRVCDASIFPSLPRANTHFPVMMAAEMVAGRW
jgi:choline dehydrogenase-like flavoprotein